jgi:hypothetical protein
VTNDLIFGGPKRDFGSSVIGDIVVGDVFDKNNDDDDDGVCRKPGSSTIDVDAIVISSADTC